MQNKRDRPLDGINVVELGVWVAAPSAAGLLSDWGADVIKIEPPSGDPLRGMKFVRDSSCNPPFELDNRGKRSICLDLRTAEGREVAGQLIARADVFVSNIRASALARLGLDYATLSEGHPRLVYAAITGYGDSGPEADRAAYDVGAFWARAGVARAVTPGDIPPPMQRSGMGDHWAGVAAAAGIAAALFQRTHTGTGQLVSTSLLRIGTYALGWDLSVALRTGKTTPQPDREAPPNPLFNSYRTADGHWLWLLGLEADRHWPSIVAALQLTDLRDDSRFLDIRSRGKHASALVSILDATFATKPLAEWAARLDDHEVWWAPVQSPVDLLHDPQADHAGVFVDVDGSDGRVVAGPVDFDGCAVPPCASVPEFGQHTEEILLELGYDWSAITGLAAHGAIP